VNTGAFSGSGNSDIPIAMKQETSRLGRKTKKLFNSTRYIPIALNNGTATGAFIVDISAPAEHGIQKQTKRFPLSIKSGTKNTYTLKPKGTAFVPNPNCDDPNADNYGKPLPCQYIPKCTDPDATNNGGNAPCQYPPTPSIVSFNPSLIRANYGSCCNQFIGGSCSGGGFIRSHTIPVTINNFNDSFHKLEHSVSTSGDLGGSVRHKSFSKYSGNTWYWKLDIHWFQYYSMKSPPNCNSFFKTHNLTLNVTIRSKRTNKVLASGSGSIPVKTGN